jgi:hypothetical protein
MNDYLTRRAALGRLLGLGSLLSPGVLSSLGAACAGEQSDQATFNQIMRRAEELVLVDEPLGEVVGSIGRMFLETPYVAHTLEVEGPERLVVHLGGLDCLTFVESTLALARCVRRGRTTMDDFRAELQQLRYRDGRIDGYPSRLHYFTDWVEDNVRKGIVQDLSSTLGGRARTRRIDFMSTHREDYRQLANDAFLESIRETEARLSAAPHAVIPKASVRDILPELHTGDIVGLSSTVEGLDIAHTGIAVRMNGVVRLLHASLSQGAVVLSTGSIADYLEHQKKQDGCILARPLEPEASPGQKP